MAKYKKKRARELKHDKFRDAAMKAFEDLGERLEGKGRAILYGIGGLNLGRFDCWPRYQMVKSPSG